MAILRARGKKWSTNHPNCEGYQAFHLPYHVPLHNYAVPHSALDWCAEICNNKWGWGFKMADGEDLITTVGRVHHYTENVVAYITFENLNEALIFRLSYVA